MPFEMMFAGSGLKNGKTVFLGLRYLLLLLIFINLLIFEGFCCFFKHLSRCLTDIRTFISVSS